MKRANIGEFEQGPAHLLAPAKGRSSVDQRGKHVFAGGVGAGWGTS